MLFGRDHREAVAAELGTSDPKMVSRALGDKWAAQVDKSTWEAMAAKDKARFERENAVYQASLQEEEDAIAEAAAAAAAGPSEREVERAEKRARMEEEAAARAEKPKAPKKVKTMSAEEKQLAAQNKEIMGDKEAAAKQRLNFLLGQSDLFRHFGLKADGEGEKKKKKGRKSEKEEDDEMMGSMDGGGAGGSSRCAGANGSPLQSAHTQMRFFQALGGASLPPLRPHLPLPSALCPLPSALCPLPSALCPLPYILCGVSHRTSLDSLPTESLKWRQQRWLRGEDSREQAA